MAGEGSSCRHAAPPIRGPSPTAAYLSPSTPIRPPRSSPSSVPTSSGSVLKAEVGFEAAPAQIDRRPSSAGMFPLEHAALSRRVRAHRCCRELEGQLWRFVDGGNGPAHGSDGTTWRSPRRARTRCSHMGVHVPEFDTLLEEDGEQAAGAKLEV